MRPVGVKVEKYIKTVISKGIRSKKKSEREVRIKLSKIFDSKKYCSASFDDRNCKLPIKGAHTVQRGRVLSSMAKDGHVGTFYRNINGFEKLRDIKTGIKKEASIFYGFCEYHDTELTTNKTPTQT
jgi:hypothetical protein